MSAEINTNTDDDTGRRPKVRKYNPIKMSLTVMSQTGQYYTNYDGDHSIHGGHLDGDTPILMGW